MTQAYPIQWPHGRPRTKNRVQSKFKVTATKAFEEMMLELSRFDAKVIWSAAALVGMRKPT